VTRVNDEDDGRHCAGEDLEGPKSKDRNNVKARISQVYLRCEIGLNELKHTLLQPGCCVLHLNSDCSSAYTLSPENRQSKCVSSMVDYYAQFIKMLNAMKDPLGALSAARKH
jgi:hypothetical protein